MKNINELEPGTSVLAELHHMQTEMATELGKASRWFGITPLTSETKSWYQGYLGEQVTAEVLKPLTNKGWKIYHSVPVGKKGSDIDHIVVSPENNIFTLNSKHHQGGRIWISEKQIRVNGQPQPYIRNSLYEAERIRNKIPNIVTPVLVFVNATVLDIKPGANKNGIVITVPANLIKTLVKFNEQLVREESFQTHQLPANFETPEFWAEKYQDHTMEHQERLLWFKDLKRHHNTALTMRVIYPLGALTVFLSGLAAFTI